MTEDVKTKSRCGKYKLENKRSEIEMVITITTGREKDRERCSKDIIIIIIIIMARMAVV